jgi:hypothetical protein
MKAKNIDRVCPNDPEAGGWWKRGARDGTALTAVVPARPVR